MLNDLVYRLRALFQRGAVEADLSDELRFHYEQEVEKHVNAGLSRQEAQRQAGLSFGGIEQTKEECRDARGVRFIETTLQDLRYGLRQLRRNPGFTTVAVLTLALGIGANTAMFSVVYAVVLHPLPFPHPERLMTVWSTREGAEDVVTPRNFDAWRHESRSFSNIAAYERIGFNLTEGDHTIRVSGALASADLFAVFGAPPLMGRTFTPDEDRPGGPNLVVLSDRLWKEQFGADRRILGRQIHLNRVGYTVIGVMPPAFDLDAGAAQLWAPLRLNGQMMNWMGGVLNVVGRLRPDVSQPHAQAEMNVIARNLEARFPEMNRERGIRVVPLARDMIGDYRQQLFVLIGAVGLVLLIACVNVTNLLLARGIGRIKELAIRAALGESHIRTLRQLLAETLLLALGAAGVGVFFAHEAIRAVISLNLANVPRINEASINGRALAFAMVLALVSTVLSGALPAWRVTRVNLLAALQQGGRSAAGLIGEKLRNAYVAVEVALALVLLTAAGLLVRSAIKALQVDPGFAADHLLTARTALPQTVYQNAGQVARAYEHILDTLKTSPGTISAALTSKVPLSSSGMGLALKPGAVVPPMKEELSTELRYISPEYFTTMRISVLSGREFTAHDRGGAPQVAIVNSALAQRLLPGRNPVGQWIRIPELDTGNPSWEVVGLVADVRDNGLMADAPSVLYVPYTQISTNAWHWARQSLFLVVRTKSQPLTLAGHLERTVHSVDPELPVASVESMEQRLDQSTATARLYADLLAALGACGLFLACMGVYGVVAYFVSRRRAEIGIRIALGATPSRLLLWVVWRGMRPVMAGIAIGLVTSLATTRLLRSQLYGISRIDPLTLAVVVVLLTGVATLACYLPARRATKVDPMVALRQE